MHLSTAFVSLFSLSLLTTAAGCSPSSTDSPSVGPDAFSSAAVDPTPDELASRGTCPPVPPGEGTSHAGILTADETWTAAGSPHKVTSGLSLRAKVTIEPCAVVLVEKDTLFQVDEDGSLVTKGTSALVDGKRDIRPVTFDALTPGAPWGPLVVLAEGTADLAVTGILNGGAESATYEGALVVKGVAGGTNDGPITRNAKIDRVLIEKSATYGVNLDGWGTFTDDSDKLWIRKSGSEKLPSAIHIEPGVAATLPKTILATDNVKNEILLTTSKAFMANDTFVNRGLPYRMVGALYVSASDDGPTVTLIIEPGVTLAFDRNGSSGNSGMIIGSSDKRLGILQAVGTAASPILFTSAKETKAPGDWVALYFRKTPATGSRISYAKIEYAGGISSTNGFGCGPTPEAGNDAAVILLGLGEKDVGPAIAWIDNTTFDNNGGTTTIVSGWTGDGPNFAPTNTFGPGTGGCHVSQPRRDTSVTGGDVCAGRRGICN